MSKNIERTKEHNVKIRFSVSKQLTDMSSTFLAFVSYQQNPRHIDIEKIIEFRVTYKLMRRTFFVWHAKV